MHLSDLEPLRPLAIAVGCVAAVIAGTWHVKRFNRTKPPFQSGKPQESGMYLVKIQPTDVLEQYSYFDGLDFHQTAETPAAALDMLEISRINWYWKRVDPV